ncbi:MAG: hypothetical protein K6E40_01100 [Desulfovibrio sp.]|nr:hypothetical protein [Desulfovibrio sp.]
MATTQNQSDQAGSVTVSTSKEEITGRLLAIFKAKTAQLRTDVAGQSAGRDVQADADAFLARIPRRFIERAVRGKSTQEECERLVDSILAEMGLASAKASPEAEARTGREVFPLQKQQDKTASKLKPSKSTKATKATKTAKAGRMPLRRPRSEDDVCDILFEIFEAKTTWPLRDASGNVVGKDSGGDEVDFIDRVPLEFIDHALRWKTTLEEYEALVYRIIAEMAPKDIGGARPAHGPSPQEEAETQAKSEGGQMQPVQPVQQARPRTSPAPGASLDGLPRKQVQRLLAHALDAAMATGFAHFDSLTDEMLDHTALDSASWSSLAERRNALFPARFAGLPSDFDARIWILGQWRGWGGHGLRVRTGTVEALGSVSAMAGDVLDEKGQKQGELRILVRPDAGSPFGFVIESLHFA